MLEGVTFDLKPSRTCHAPVRSSRKQRVSEPTLSAGGRSPEVGRMIEVSEVGNGIRTAIQSLARRRQLINLASQMLDRCNHPSQEIHCIANIWMFSLFNCVNTGIQNLLNIIFCRHRTCPSCLDVQRFPS